jgi:hypothetical protein
LLFQSLGLTIFRAKLDNFLLYFIESLRSSSKIVVMPYGVL